MGTNRRSQLQRVAFKMFLVNGWNPPCRSCLFDSAASSDFFNSVTSATRSGLVFSTSVPTISRSRRLAPPTNLPNHGKISGQNVTVWNAKACCCFQTAKWTTELQIWVHKLFEARPPTLPPTPLSLQEFDRAVSCNVCD